MLMLLHSGLGEDVADIRLELGEGANSSLLRHRALQRLGRHLIEQNSAIATLTFSFFSIPSFLGMLKKK